MLYWGSLLSLVGQMLPSSLTTCRLSATADQQSRLGKSRVQHICRYPTQSYVWLQITWQFHHTVCQPTWLASSTQCKWAYSAASWQSWASDKRMVQTWHTFKKFSLPSPNPLHCKQGWHVPNETGALVSANSPPLSGIVSS